MRPHVEKKKEDHMDIELEWLQATLNDASEALQDALQKVENGDQEDALEVLNHDLVHVYAKLTFDEIDTLGEDEEDEEAVEEEDVK